MRREKAAVTSNAEVSGVDGRRAPLRVLILNWRDPKHPQAGGAETYLFELARRWARDGHWVAWLTAGFPGGGLADSIDGVKIRRIGGRASVYGLIPLYYLLKLRGRFDVILDSENGIPFYSPLFSRVPKICVVYHVHRRVFEEHLPFPLSKLFIWLELSAMPFLYRKSSFVTISETSRDEMEICRFSSRPIAIVYSGVDSALKPGARAPQPTILYLGRLKAYKRVDALIRSMRGILAAVPDAKLVVAGEGDQRTALEQLAAEQGVSERVEFTGYIDEATKARLLGEAWVFASASAMEGWGISVLEANACATPAVVTDSPGLKVAVIGGVTGIVTPLASMTEHLIALLTDRDLRLRLAQAALERAALFSWDRSAQSMLDVMYSEVKAGQLRAR
jgi:glycosyltransferase involved in cell wall biosynthesis